MAASSAIQAAAPQSNALRSLTAFVLRHTLEPFFRLIGGKHRVWPPSRTSAPLLGSFWVVMMGILLRHLQESKHKVIDEVERRRRRLALETLDSLLKNEDER